MPTPELERLAQQTQLRTAALQLPGSPSPHALTDLYVEPVLASASGEKLSPEAALARTPALVIVGPPGSGKTTLLQRLAWTQAVDFLAGKDKRCPVFLPARSAVNLIRTLDLPTLISESFTGNYNPKLESGLLASWIVDDRVSLFIDGLDEIGRAEDRDHLFRAIQAARDTFPHLHLIVSSRPIAISGWLSSFSFFELQSFADSQSSITYVGSPERRQTSRSALPKNPIETTNYESWRRVRSSLRCSGKSSEQKVSCRPAVHSSTLTSLTSCSRGGTRSVA